MFALLVFEMSVFGLLIVPLPYSIKRKIFTFISENPLIAKLQYGLKVVLHLQTPLRLQRLTWQQITFIFILILFIDSVNRVYSVQMELAKTKQSQKYVSAPHPGFRSH